MRIRKRPQNPPLPPDLPSTQVATPTAAPVPLSGATVVVGRRLHPNGGSPIEPPGCTAHQPSRPFATAAGGDTPSSDPHPPSRTTQMEEGSHQKSGEAMRGVGEEAGALEEQKSWDVCGNGGGSSSGELKGEKKTNNNNNNNNKNRPSGTFITGVKEELVGGGEVAPGNGNNNNNTNHNGGNGKRRKSPAVLMEGSRCSRVNGRGWRCCQQTLVGYSLCEHHLGKGRLRSVSSVRCNNGGRKAKKEEKPVPSQRLENGRNHHHHHQQYSTMIAADEEKWTTAAKSRKKRKIGIVKARSISSLLDQTNQPGSTTEAPLVLPPASAAAKTQPTRSSDHE